MAKISNSTDIASKEMPTSLDSSDSFRIIVIWLLTGSIACFIALGWLSGSYIDGDYVPMGADSFYHAQRILAAVTNLSDFYQFDERMHVPEGSIVTWPWFYDLLLAIIVKTVLLFTNAKPVSVLIYIPAIWVFLNTALVIGIASRLELSTYLRLLSGLCFALSPLTLALHGAGAVDHHYAELTIVLVTLYAALGWFKSPESWQQAAIFGAMLGLGYGVHNGLFVLQIPVLISLTILWITGKLPSSINVRSFNISFIATSLVLIVPSLAFRQGLFEFFTLSVFHFYITLCTLFYVNWLCRFKFSVKNAGMLLGICLLLVIPLAREAIAGFTFIGSDIEGYERITETVGVFAMLSHPSWSIARMSAMYSWLIWLVPVVILIGVSKLIRLKSYSGYEIFFWVYSLFGLLFLLQQYRFHYFGSFALYLPLLVVVQQWINRASASHRSYGLAALSLVVVLSYLTTPKILLAKQPLALDSDHHLFRPLYLELAKQCQKEPGVVLADTFDGHHLTYYTDCSVISNNFLINQQHVEKYHLVNSLLSLDVNSLVNNQNKVDYVFVRIFRRDQVSGGFSDNDIRKELLAYQSRNFSGMQLIAESPVTAQVGNKTVNVGRVYKILRREQ